MRSSCWSRRWAGEDPKLDRQEFYSRLAEGVGRLSGMRRVVIFRFDEVTRRVEAAGGYGIDLDVFADLRVGLEAAPDAPRATARTATFHGERARELQQRIELARDVHERVVQRLFGVSMVLSPPGGSR
jgi:signal transduction histidine kinase